MEEYRKRAIVGKKERQEKSTFTLPEGPTIFRLLRTPEDQERNSPEAYIEYYMHYNIGPKKFRVRCGVDVDGNGECWLCQKIEKEKLKGRTKLAESMERKKTFEVQVAVWDDDLGSLTGPKRWVSSGNSAKGIPYKLLSILSSEKASRYLHSKRGYNFRIERSGTGMTDTVYTAPEREEEPSEVPVQIMKKLKPFADVIPAYDEDYQKRAYYGTENDDEEEQGGKVKSRRRDEDEEEVVVKKKRKVVDEDEELEEDSLGEEDDLEYGQEDEDEPKPKKKKVVEEDEDEEEAPRPKKRKVVDEDEDEPTPDEDDDDTPKKKKRVVEEEGDEEEAPRPKKRKVIQEEDEEEEPQPKKKVRKPEPDEEDELELEEDVEEDEEEPQPKKKKVVVEEDEDEEPQPKKKRVVQEEDEEEEEAPRPKRKK